MEEVASQNFIETILSDPVALYAAILSTVIAVTASIRFIYNWITDGPKAWVELVHPLETYMGAAEIIIANIGKHPFVVRELRFSEHKSKNGAPFKTSTHNHKTLFDPATKLLPDPSGKPNHQIREPRILRPGEEDHHHSVTSSRYDPHSDWLSTTIFIRGRKAPLIAWCPPIPAPIEE